MPIPKIPYTGGGGGGVGDQLSTIDPKSKNAKILNPLYDGLGGGGGRVAGVTQLPTFDAESKNVKIPNSLGKYS